MKEIKVLDKGFVKVMDIYGSDLTVVNAARVSFGGEKTELDDKDKRLINYLYKHRHDSPFRHIYLQLRIYAPEFVMRQWYKHVVGIEATSHYATKDHAWNEISGRYREVEDHYIPELWRKQSEDNKQGSSGTVEDQAKAKELYAKAIDSINECYKNMIEMGVAKEQARILLPLSQYTEVVWTASFQAIANFIKLREDAHSQLEIQEYAAAVDTLFKESFPASYEVFREMTDLEHLFMKAAVKDKNTERLKKMLEEF